MKECVSSSRGLSQAWNVSWEVYSKLENCHRRNWSPDQGMKNPSPYKQHWGLEQPCALPEAGLANLVFKTSPSQEDAQVIISSCKVPHRKKKNQVCLILKILYKHLHPPTAAMLHRVRILPGLASFPAPAEGYSATQQHHRDGFQYCSSKSREITHLSPKICKPQNGNRKKRFFSCSTIWSYRIIP